MKDVFCDDIVRRISNNIETCCFFIRCRRCMEKEVNSDNLHFDVRQTSFLLGGAVCNVNTTDQ